jgi:hypothetical protein
MFAGVVILFALRGASQRYPLVAGGRFNGLDVFNPVPQSALVKADGL